MFSTKMQNDFMKEFFKIQEKGGEMWPNWQNNFNYSPEENTMDNLNKWIKKNQEMFLNNISLVDGNQIKDVFNKMSEGMSSYTNLFNFWQELQKQTVEDKASENVQEFINKWKDDYIKMLSENVMSEMPNNIVELTKEPMKLFKIYNDYNFNFMDPFSVSSKEYFENSPFSDKEYVKSYQTYINTLNEFFTMFREKAVETMEIIVVDYQNMMKEGNAPKDFNEFYNYWFNRNNDVVNELLGTDEFSKLLAKLSKESLNYKKNHDIILEKQVKWMPFPLKSDMRSLYKTIYDLRKEVKSLKKQLNGR